jgi:hypothetical protein
MSHLWADTVVLIAVPWQDDVIIGDFGRSLATVTCDTEDAEGDSLGIFSDLPQ